MAGGADAAGQLGRLRRPDDRAAAWRGHDDLRRLRRREVHHPRRLHRADDAVGHQVQRRLQRRRRRSRPRRRPAQPAVLPARCRRRRRRPPHRPAGREAAARQGRRHLGRRRDDLRQRPGGPLHRAAHLLRPASCVPLRRRPDAAGDPRGRAVPAGAGGCGRRPLPRQHAQEALPWRPRPPHVRRVLGRPARPARHRGRRRRRQGAAAAGAHPGRQPGAQRRRALQGHGARAAHHLRRRGPGHRALRRPRRRVLRDAHRGAQARGAQPHHRPARPAGPRHRAAGRARLLRGRGQRRHPAAPVAAAHPPPTDPRRRRHQPCRARAGHGRAVGLHLRRARPGLGPGGRQGRAPRRRRLHDPGDRPVDRAGAGRPRGPARPS